MTFRTPTSLTAGLAAFALVAAAPLASGQVVSNLLTNPSFEAADASGGDVPNVPGFFRFGDAFTSAAFDARTGDNVLKIFGPFVDGGGAGVGQAVAAAPGDEFLASAFLRSDSLDPIDPSNFALVQLQFLDSGGTVLTSIDSAQGNSTTLPANTYVPFAATGVAPAGTTQAQIVLLQVQLAPVTGGSIIFDDASLGTVVPEPATLGLAALGGLTLLRRRRA